MMHPRQEWHERAKEFIRQGEYTKAQTELTQCLDLMGPHVDLLCDLAGVYYRQNDFEKFKFFTAKAYTYFNANKKNLNESTDIYVRYKLANSLMEAGLISLVPQLFSGVVRSLDNRKNQIQYDRLMCVKLDYAILIQDKSLMNQAYRELERLAERTEISEATIQHSLSMADFYLLGVNTAQARVDRALGSSKINSLDREWIIFDHLYNHLFLGNESDFSSKLLSEFNYRNVGLFEKFVWDVLQIRKGSMAFEPITLARIEGMNVLSMLRLLSLVVKTPALQNIFGEAKSKIDLYMSEMDKASQKILRQYFFSHINDSKSISIEDGRVRSKLGAVLFKGVSRDLLEMVSSQKSLRIEDVCQKLFGEEVNDMTMNRLRVALSRLNKKLFPVTGVQNSISIHDSNLRLNIDFKLAS